MEMIEVYAIQKYYGRDNRGNNWFIFDIITVPMHKYRNVCLMNKIIPLLFKLPEEQRKIMIDNIILSNHNNGINQYFPFLKDYASESVSNFVLKATINDN